MNSMGTETKVKCLSENTASGITRAQKPSDNLSIDADSTSPNNGTQPPTLSQISNSSKIPFVPVQVDENDVIGGAKQIILAIRPYWNLDFVEYKKFTDGITNKLIGCFYNPPSEYNITTIVNTLNSANIAAGDNAPTQECSRQSPTSSHQGYVNNADDENNDSGNLSDADADSESESQGSTKRMPIGKSPSNVVLVRVYGNKTDLLIDRKAETRNIMLLHSYGFAPTLYATFKNGLAYDFVPGDTLNTESVLRPEVWSLVAQRMAQMHRIVKPDWYTGAPGKATPMLWKKVQSFFDLVPERFSDANKQKRLEGTFLPIKRMRDEFSELYKRLETLESPVVFAHNDLLLGNVVHTESRKTVTFIDYEYADFNFQAFDIGNHFAEFAGVDTVDYTRYPNRDFQLKWLRLYLQSYHERSDITDAEVERLYVQVNQFALASHFFWLIWSLIQAEHSTIDFDYVEYAFLRYNEFLAKKEEFLALDTQHHTKYKM